MAPFLKPLLLTEKSSYQQFVMKLVQKRLIIADNLTFQLGVVASKMAPFRFSSCLVRLKVLGNGARSFPTLTKLLKITLTTQT